MLILGDSIVKNVNGYLLTKKLRHKKLIKVRSFSGAKVSRMYDHVKPTIREFNPNHILLHVGTNELKSSNNLKSSNDFHKMSLTVMKVFYNKQKPRIIQYRKYKGFSNEAFMHELESALARFSQISFGTFKSTVDNILQKHAPIKKRYVRANQASFINSKINK